MGLQKTESVEAGLSLSKLVSPQSRKGRLAADALRQKLESRSWKLGKYELRVSKASIDTSPGAPGTTLNENRTLGTFHFVV